MQVKKIFKFIFVVFFAVSLSQFSAFSEITGDNKVRFKVEYISTCYESQRLNQWNKKFSNKEIYDYCSCVSNHITERASVLDVNNSTEKLLKIIDDGGVLCTARYFMNR
jgi:hypothetical protein